MRPMGDWSMRMTLSISVGAGESFVRAGFLARAIELLGEGAIEDVVHQSRFAGAGDAGHDRHDSQGEYDVEILQVIFARPKDGE